MLNYSVVTNTPKVEKPNRFFCVCLFDHMFYRCQNEAR